MKIVLIVGVSCWYVTMAQSSEQAESPSNPKKIGTSLPEVVGPSSSQVSLNSVIAQPLSICSEKQVFRGRYRIFDSSFCYASACVDVDNDSSRDLFFASRQTRKLSRLNAADGKVVWSKSFEGDQQSISARDLNGDGIFEILYTVSNPGRMYELNGQGETLSQWDAGDGKLGNSPVIFDADHDGILDGFLGSRNRYLLRVDMKNTSLLGRREEWSQCGCHTSAMDVDHDGKWDLFAGTGDDFGSKGSLHRIDPSTLKTVWAYATNDNASSADPVLVDLDRDGRVEIVKSVDNYAGDDAHDAIFAFNTDGQVLWSFPGLSGEDSPNVADLQGDGSVEIVGMTFGGEVYCLNNEGRILWRKDVRPDLDNSTHAYMTPILCDLNGDESLEILAITNGHYFDDRQPNKKKIDTSSTVSNGVNAVRQVDGVAVSSSSNATLADVNHEPAILFAMNSNGDILDQLELDGPRYFGEAFVCDLDDDGRMEIILSGSGGLDVIQTTGLGPRTEYTQRRRNYQRLNVVRWAYEDSYFLDRGIRNDVVHRADNLVLTSTRKNQTSATDVEFVGSGSYTTELLKVPEGCEFRELKYETRLPRATSIQVNVLGEDRAEIQRDVQSGTQLCIDRPIRLQFNFSTKDRRVSPLLDSYCLEFGRKRDRKIVVETEGDVRHDVPAMIELPSDLLPEHGRDSKDSKNVGFQLFETTGGRERFVPSQVENASPAKLWWIVDGLTPSRTRRTYRLSIDGQKQQTDSNSEPVHVEENRDFVEVRIGESKVLRYNTSHIAPPESLDSKYGRSAHIHPVWTPSGRIVTDQFPVDHPHQSGIFLANTKTEFEGRQPDFWNLLGGNGRVRFKQLASKVEGSVFGEFTVDHEHIELSKGEAKSTTTEKVVLNEIWQVRVWNTPSNKPDHWICDITSHLRCASSSPLVLKQYPYGGMALRGASQWTSENSRFLTSEGKDREQGNHSRPLWCDVQGLVSGSMVGLTIMTHKQNFRYPEPLRIHPKMPYMVYTPSFLGDWSIEPGKPVESRYRFVFHDGEIDRRILDRLADEFSGPIVASFDD